MCLRTGVISKVYDIVVIGGGASGLFAAIAAKYHNNNLSVAILERNERVGKKILSTGNGRCNLTNENIELDRFHGENVKFAKSALLKFDKDTTLQYFMQMGIFPKTEGDKVYPNSLQASSVVDVLRLTVKSLGISEICNYECISIYKNDEIFTLKIQNGQTIAAKSVIVCAGGAAAPNLGTDGSAYKLLENFGHKLLPIYPSLVQVRCDSKLTMPMKGVKTDANVSAYVNGKFEKTEFGELLFTDYGLSGPVIFQLSRIASVGLQKKHKIVFEADIMPQVSRDEVYYHLCCRNREVPVEDFLTGMINKLCARQLLKKCGVQKFNTTAEVLSDDAIAMLADTIKSWKFEITGTNSWQQAQVTAGGICTDDFNPSTMESNLCNGLYAAGEILDIDGDCGGFNLQWAWSSGFVAGTSAAKKFDGR